MDSIWIAHTLAMLLLGAALGFFGGVFGIGGGIIAVPLFVLGFGMEQAHAQGTALVLMVPNLLIAWWRYNQKHKAPLGLALSIALAGTLATWGGARIAVGLNQTVLHALFNTFLLVVGVRQLRGPANRMVNPAKPTIAAPTKHMRWAVPGVGLLGGATMGLLGLGGALVSTPILTGALKLRQTLAQSLSLALVFPSASVALASYAQAGRVSWAIALPLAIGGLFTVSAGVNYAHKLPENTLRKAFAGLMIGTAVWLVVRSFLTTGGC